MIPKLVNCLSQQRKFSYRKNTQEEGKKEQKPKTRLKNDLYKKVEGEDSLLYEAKNSLLKPSTKSKQLISALKSA